MNRVMLPAVAGCALLLAIVPSALQAGVIRLQAEDFHAGGQGVGWNNTTTGDPQVYRTAGPGQELCSDDGGGYNITTTAAGEWLRLTTDPGNWQTDPTLPVNNYYLVTARVASAATGAQAIRVELGPSPGVNLTGSMSFANTGGGQNWASVTAITRTKIPTGTQQILAVWETANVNLNWIELATGSEWKLASGTSNWHVAANWTEGIPNSADAFAILGSTYGTGTRTVTVNAPTTVGHLLFDSTGKYTLSGTSTLTFQVSPGVDTARILALSGSHDISAPVVLGSTLTVDVNDSIRTLAFLGNISGSGGLVKLGPGALSLRGAANTYTGGTTVQAGRLTVPNTGGSLGPGLLTVGSAGTVNLQVPTVTVSGLSGSGTINLGSASPQINTVLRVQGSASSSFSGKIQDISGTAGKLEVGGGATLELKSENTYSGGTAINTGGRVEVSHRLCFGPGPVTLNGGTLARPPMSPGLLGRYYNGYDSPGGAPAWMNTLATVLNHLATVTPNHIAPTTTGGQADLYFRTNSPEGAIYSNQGFTRQYNYAVIFEGYINLPLPGTYTFVTGSDDGTMIWIDDDPTPVVSNNYSQGYTERSGTYNNTTPGLHKIIIPHSNGGGPADFAVYYTPPGGSRMTVPNSVLFHYPLAGSMTVANNIVLTANSTIESPFGDFILTGPITGAFGFRKTGAGTLVLQNANNTYSGQTEVVAGTLALVNSLPNSAVIVQDGGNIALGTSRLLGRVSLPGLTFNQSTAVTGATFKLATPDNSDKLTVGALAVTGRVTINLIDYALSGPGTFPLIQYTTFPGSLANFTLGTTDLGDYTASLALNTGAKTLEAVLTYLPNQWAISTGGLWSFSTNWTKGGGPGTIPDRKGTANFLGNLVGEGTVDLAGTNRTVRLVKFDNTAGSYTIGASGAGRLVMDSDYGNARIWVASGNHTISAPVQLNIDTSAMADAGAKLTITGPVTGTNRVLKLDGAGTVDVVLNSAVTSTVGYIGAGAGEKKIAAMAPGTTTFTGNLGLETGLTLHAGNTDTTAVFEGAISGAGGAGINKTGPGTAQLVGVNSSSSPIRVNEGTVRLSRSVSAGNGVIYIGDATFGTAVPLPGLLAKYYSGHDAGNGAPSWMNTLAGVRNEFAGVAPDVIAPTTTAGQQVIDFRDNTVEGAIYRFQGFTRQYNYSAVFEGYINLPLVGTYTFITGSDDGSMIWIDDNPTAVVSNNYAQGYTERSGNYNNTTPGLHKILLTHSNGTGPGNFAVFYTPPGGTRTTLPNSVLFHGYFEPLVLANDFVLTGAATIDVGSLGISISGDISGTGGLTKIGSAQLLLAGEGTYKGPTVLSGGKLRITGTAAGTSRVTAAAATELELANDVASVLAATTPVVNQGKLSVLNGVQLMGDLTGNGETVIEAGTTLSVSSLYQNTVTIKGEVDKPGKLVFRSSAGADLGGGSVGLAGSEQLAATAVPEPTSAALALAALLMVLPIVRPWRSRR